MYEILLQKAISGDRKSIARCISLIENESPGYEILVHTSSTSKPTPVIGITGPPGAGKSTLADAIIMQLVEEGKRIAVICVDPSSAFHQGALLGDRIRMTNWFNSENVYIRSLATRGSLGGLSAAVLEILLFLNECPFDYIIVETVGVGQSEVEIAGLADVTVVVLVPEGGDEIQTMKAGLMEIADIFVVNKSDRPGADLLIKNLLQMTAPGFSRKSETIPVIKTIASQQEGIVELIGHIRHLETSGNNNDARARILALRAWQLIQKKRMKDISFHELEDEIREKLKSGDFSLSALVGRF